MPSPSGASDTRPGTSLQTAAAASVKLRLIVRILTASRVVQHPPKNQESEQVSRNADCHKVQDSHNNFLDKRLLQLTSHSVDQREMLRATAGLNLFSWCSPRRTRPMVTATATAKVPATSITIWKPSPKARPASTAKSDELSWPSAN